MYDNVTVSGMKVCVFPSSFIMITAPFRSEARAIAYVSLKNMTSLSIDLSIWRSSSSIVDRSKSDLFCDASQWATVAVIMRSCWWVAKILLDITLWDSLNAMKRQFPVPLTCIICIPLLVACRVRD